MKISVSKSSLFAIIVLAVGGSLLTGCCSMPRNWKSQYDPPMNYEGRRQIALYNAERLLDAKQEWAKDTGARKGELSPSPEVLADKYYRKYEYGRRAPGDDDTQNLPIYKSIDPSGAEYAIGAVGERPKSTVHGDILRDYDVKTSAVGHRH
jgi:hypothetical protein